MWTLNKFLCFDLEAGGKFLAWFGMISCIVLIPVVIWELIYFPSMPCDDFMKLVDTFVKKYTDKMGLIECDDIKEAFVNLLLITLVSYCCIFVAYFLLLRGIVKKSHKLVLPVIVFVIIFLITHASVLIFVLVVDGPCHCYFFVEVFAVIVGIYIFLTLYSLYVKYRDENGGNGGNIQYNK
ncbi:uncharacterized protein [Chironomus tepperi]|uniref:uncharacterized protein n=1 Tax=Chironomus tepperi TaxID=113505 RepID=UPI00391F67A6